MKAAYWLGEIAHPSSLNWLLDTTDDADLEVRREVRKALAAFMPEGEIDERVRARKQELADAEPQSAPAPSASVASKPTPSQAWLEKAWNLNVDAPGCFKCGTPLGGGESLLHGGGRMLVAGATAGSPDAMREGLALFEGTICNACVGVFCMNCASEPIDSCPECGGRTVPAFRRELLEFRGQAGARRVAAATSTAASTAAVAVDESDSMVALYAEEIMRFLTTERTREYEQQTGAWWTVEHLRLILAKAGFMDDAGELFVPRVDAAIRSLLVAGKLLQKGTEYRAR